MFSQTRPILLVGLLLFAAQSCLSKEKLECPGITCPVDMVCAPNGALVCIPQGCGDGQVVAGEECDAGGVETAECNINCTIARCGDGIKTVAAGEECDDGNNIAFDGCDATCRLEMTCGNDRLDPGEECEKGRGNQETATCNHDCTLVKCNDQIVNQAAGEVCINENLAEEQCAYGLKSCLVCSSDCKAWVNQTGPYCGDGIINGPVDAEQCDVVDMPEFCLGSSQCKCAPARESIYERMELFSVFKSTEELVFDSKNGLVWQRKDDNNTYTWQEAISYCNSLKLAGCSGWRLPTAFELETLIDENNTPPHINKEAFPSSHANYWTLSDNDDNYYALAAFFKLGTVDWSNKSVNLYVRCVR